MKEISSDNVKNVQILENRAASGKFYRFKIKRFNPPSNPNSKLSVLLRLALVAGNAPHKEIAEFFAESVQNNLGIKRERRII